MKTKRKEHIKLDMDNVIVDLDGHVIDHLDEDFHSMPWADKEKHWNEKFVIDWFLDAPPMKDAFELVDYCMNNYYNVSILTALPHGRRDMAWQSMEAKIAWVHKYLGKEIPITFGPYAEDKKKHCDGNDFILIDDSEKNILDWRSVGGHAILHRNTENTIRELMAYHVVMERSDAG